MNNISLSKHIKKRNKNLLFAKKKKGYAYSQKKKKKRGVRLRQRKPGGIKKRKQVRGEASAKTTPPPQSQHESLIKQMTTADNVIKFLRKNRSQKTSTYTAAIKRCSELKQPNALYTIVQLAHQQNVPLNIIYCNTVLHYLDAWNKSGTQKKLFEQWFIHKELTSSTTPFNPDLITLSTMIQGCSKRGDVKQALYYFQLLVNDYNIKPDRIVYNSMLSICASTCDMESAEIIWNTMQSESNIQIDALSINCMLDMYAKCGESKKLADLLNYSQQLEHFISIDEITCLTIMSKLLKNDKVDEMFDFYENQIPKLSLKSSINIKDKRFIYLKISGHLKKMELLDKDEFDKLSYHHQQYLNIFYNEQYPLVKDEPVAVDNKDIRRLLCSYVLLHKNNWMNAVKDVERILHQEPNFVHFFKYWTTGQQKLLDFRSTSNTIARFMLRYLMTFKRDQLQHEFKNGPIKILCEKKIYLKKVKEGESYTSSKMRSIHDELREWKIVIRSEQDAFNNAVWCLNQDDTLLFFQKVPSGEDCLK
ncbi:hypothetical protein RFI_12431 [Reticulomyxa filosa]|uniref:PROP1-like PPR domain-containing protein n=1 Tax=Reticulomyxa filosa TaxID=46433 RepID=X6NFH0_RETFI|nr:hypothetical protein RFI_12431 [Reticulomyxa filosa]|eukprot:ETO24726.1 hypothetical protein RFI_12431 [Reticulomyxa filosa]